MFMLWVVLILSSKTGGHETKRKWGKEAEPSIQCQRQVSAQYQMVPSLGGTSKVTVGKFLQLEKRFHVREALIWAIFLDLWNFFLMDSMFLKLWNIFFSSDGSEVILFFAASFWYYIGKCSMPPNSYHHCFTSDECNIAIQHHLICLGKI